MTSGVGDQLPEELDDDLALEDQFTRTFHLLLVKIQRARQLLNCVPLRPGHKLLDLAVCRLLWSAIAAADGIRAIVQEQRFIGSEPLLRFLAESSLSLEYLISLDEPDLAAMHSFIADIRNLNSVIDLQGSLEKDRPAERAFPSVGEALEALRGHLVEDLAEAPEVVDALIARGRETISNHWHWSGGPPGNMIRRVWTSKDQYLDDFRESLERAQSAHWRFASRLAHPSPRWDDSERIAVNNDGETVIRNPLEKNIGQAYARAGLAQTHLLDCIQSVASFYELELFGSSSDEIIEWVVGLDLDSVDPTKDPP
jgi:hypothetical protein